jgi:hypothetical protein
VSLEEELGTREVEMGWQMQEEQVLIEAEEGTEMST